MSEGGDDPTFIIVLVIVLAVIIAAAYYASKNVDDAPSGGYTPKQEASYRQRARGIIEEQRYANMPDDDPRKIEWMVTKKLKSMGP